MSTKSTTNGLNCKYSPSRLGSAIGSRQNAYKREEFFTSLILDCFKQRDENISLQVLNSIQYIPDAKVDAPPTPNSGKGDVRLMKGVIEIDPASEINPMTEAIDLTDDDLQRPKGSSDDDEITLKRKQRPTIGGTAAKDIPSTIGLMKTLSLDEQQELQDRNPPKSKKFIRITSSPTKKGGTAPRYQFNVFLKFFGSPTYLSTALWYESLINQFVLPYIVRHTPHVMLPMYNIYNISAAQLQSVRDPALRSVLLSYVSTIETNSTRKVKTLGVTVMADINRMPTSSQTDSMTLLSFLFRPSNYFVKYGVFVDPVKQERDARHVFFSMIFRILYTLEVFNRKLIRHNDLHCGNVIMVRYSDESMRDNAFTYHVDPTYSPTTKYGVEPRTIQSNWMPYIIDWDRAWVYDIKWYNTAITPDSMLCYDFGQCSRMNPYYDTFMFLMSVKRALDATYDTINGVVTPLPFDPLRDKMKQWFYNEFLSDYISQSSIDHFIEEANKIKVGNEVKARWEYVAYKGLGDATDLDQHCKSTYDLLTLPLFSELFGGQRNPALASFEWASSKDIVSRFELPPKIDPEYEQELKASIGLKLENVANIIKQRSKAGRDAVPDVYTELSNITSKNFSRVEDHVLYKHVLTQTELK